MVPVSVQDGGLINSQFASFLQVKFSLKKISLYMSHFSKLLHLHDDLVTNVWDTGEAFLQPQHNFVILTVYEPLGKRCIPKRMLFVINLLLVLCLE